MSTPHNSGFDKAQRDHDKQLPESWHEDLEREERKMRREEEIADDREDEE